MYTTTAYFVFSLIVSILAGAFVSRLLYAWPWSDGSKGYTSKILFFIRTISIAIVLLLLLNPGIYQTQIQIEKPRIVFLHDNSQSIKKLTDSATREKLNTKVRKFDETLSDKLDIDHLYFDGNVHKDPNFNGSVTDIAGALKHVSQTGTQPPTALVLLSDGNYNRGENPVFASRQLPFPIYSVLLGDTIPGTSIFFQHIYHNTIGYLNEKNPVDIDLRYAGLKNDTTITIQIASENTIITEKQVKLNADLQRKSLQLFFKASHTGLQQFFVQIKNNEEVRRSFFMDIREEKQEVLVLYHAVHPDIGAITRALKKSNRFKPILAQANKFKGSVADYPFVVLHQIPSGNFMEDKWFADVVEKKIPFWIILGSETDYSMFNQGQGALKIVKRTGEYEETGVSYTNDFNWFKTNTGIEQAEMWPPLHVPFGEYQQIKGTNLFMQTVHGVETDRPAWLFQDKPYRMTILCGTGLWRWRMYEHRTADRAAVVDDLIFKTVKFLSLNEPRKRLVIDHQQVYESTQPVTFDAVWYNENYERDNALSGQLTLIDSAGQQYTFSFLPKNDSYEAKPGVLPSGKYAFKALFHDDRQEYTDSGRFVVNPTNIEMNSYVANHMIMRQLSSNSRFFTLSTFDQLTETLRTDKTVQPLRKVTKHFDDLIDLRSLLVALLFMLVGEWVWRKYSGL
ncbi:MAG: hypothetical protein R6U85_03350 [Salinivirgaceae bacterium]